MEIVAITGGCGVLGRHVVRRLCENSDVAEVRVIDRCRSRPESHQKLRYYVCDISAEADLNRALTGVTTVIHAAKADIPLTYQTKDQLRQMWKDNVDATEVLVERVCARGIPRLIHVGDAYSALPVDDNFGLSEDIHRGLPTSFLLGEWGESRCRAELIARKIAQRADSQLTAIFLRPTWIHSELPSSMWRGLRDLLEQGKIPYTADERRGHHQFIYAGNVAATIEKCIFQLRDDPQRYANEIVYLNDQTVVREFAEVLRERAHYYPQDEVSFTRAYVGNRFRHFAYLLGKNVEGELHFHTWRALFEKVIGFSDKKSRLLLGFKPEVSVNDGFSRSLRMFEGEDSTRIQKTATMTSPIIDTYSGKVQEETDVSSKRLVRRDGRA